MLYLHITASTFVLDVAAEPPDSLELACHLKATREEDGPDVPFTGPWPIRFRQTDGFGFDSVIAEFTDGACLVRYDAQDMLPGDWLLDEECFEPIMLNGEECDVFAASKLCITFVKRTC